jgi:CRISPR/Cas system Type II protein with McrA/HNH and RuvC-like nuclease domain
MDTKPKPPQCPIHNCGCSNAYGYRKCRCDACREWQSERARDYKERNPEACRERDRKWYQNNKADYTARSAARKANMKISHLPPEEQELIHKIYKKAQEFKDQGLLDVHVDHVIPLSKDGTHTSDNLVIISAEDNRFKSNKEISSRTATHMIVEGREIEIMYPHY